MSNYATENLRTLALVGHGSCGKTTLIEAMLYRAGMIPEMGSIQRGTTMSVKRSRTFNPSCRRAH